MKKLNRDHLECIHCDKEFKLGETFVCHINNKELITICSCINEDHPVNTEAEDIGGWIVVTRGLQGYNQQQNETRS